MLVRGVAQSNTDFLLSSWSGFALFYFISIRTSPGSERALLWALAGLRKRGFPTCFSLCLGSHLIFNQTMLLLGMSATEPLKFSCSSCPSLSPTGLPRTAPGLGQCHAVRADAPRKRSPSVATWHQPAAPSSPKQPGWATSSWRTLLCLFTPSYFARGTLIIES